MKNQILILFLLVTLITNAQEEYSNLIVGTWKFEENCDFRTDTEKNEFAEIPWCPPVTDNASGRAIITYNENGTYSEYFTKEHIQYGKWKIKDDILIEKNRISTESAKSNEQRIENYIKKGLISKGSDGYYYQRPIEIDIKSITDKRLEFGSEKQFSIWRRIK